MNAKKIMGAVLVALLAAALFVGAGAAADKEAGTLFYFETAQPDMYGTWSFGTYSFTLDSINDYVSDTKLPVGKYSNGTHYIALKKPTATAEFTAVTPTGTTYIVGNGGVLYQGSSVVYTVTPPGTASIDTILVVGPDNVPYDITTTTFAKTGLYKIKALFDKNDFAIGAPADALESDVILSFTVAKAGELTIKADVESVTVGDSVAITITGEPGEDYDVKATKFNFTSLGTVPAVGTPTDTFVTITMPNTGKAVIYAEAVSSGEGKVTVKRNDGTGDEKEFTAEIVKGTITAKAEQDSYYIGNKIKLSGVTNAGDDLFVYIKGTNKYFDALTTSMNQITDIDGKNWKFEVEGSYFKYFDAGTYTVFISTEDASLLPAGADWEKHIKEKGVYTTVSLVLKQPFIGDIVAPAVAIKDSDYKVTGTVEATKEIYAYIFGTNFFAATDGTAAGTVGKLGANAYDLTIKNGKFALTVKIPKSGMDAGQYFLVVQHPMYDGKFNIAPVGANKIYLNTTGTAVGGPNETLLVDIDGRQKTNAAQALCDALETQNIDDMYAKASFIVAAPTSIINPIPTEITKGSKLTISGNTNVGEDKMVMVELLSTAFAAVPKETVGSAAFVALTTKTDKDGNWVVEFDTSGLNVDEYTVSVAVADLDASTAKINVIEGAPVQPTTTETQPTQTEQPTQPTQTQQPTTPPKTPGFGALAALAGLGAVAVLLLRRE